MSGAPQGGPTANRRSAILAGAAALLVGLLALDTLFVRAPEPAAHTGGADVAATGSGGLTPGAPEGLDRRGLAARYRPIDLARLFAPRDFRDRPAPSAGPAPARSTPRAPDAPAAPPPVSLRFTGVVGTPSGRLGVLEAQGTGRGLLAAAGLRLGPLEVAAVGTDALTLTGPAGSQRVGLGEKLDLEPSQLPPLEAFAPTTGAASAATTSAPGVPQLSEEERASVLERLRARRRRSLSDASDAPAADGATPPTASTPTPAATPTPAPAPAATDAPSNSVLERLRARRRRALSAAASDTEAEEADEADEAEPDDDEEQPEGEPQ